MKHNLQKITLISALGAGMFVATTPAQAAFQLKIDGQATLILASQVLNMTYPNGDVPSYVTADKGFGGGFTLGMLYGPGAQTSGNLVGLNIGFNYIQTTYAKDVNYVPRLPNATLTFIGTNYLIPMTIMLGYQFALGPITITPSGEIGLAYNKYNQTLESNLPLVQGIDNIPAKRSYKGYFTFAAGAGLSLGYAFNDTFALNVTGKWGYMAGKKNIGLESTNVDGSIASSDNSEFGSVSYITAGLGGTFAF